MVGKTRALVLNGYGINCPVETAYSIKTAGGNAEIRHASEILENPKLLEDYNFLVFPGGFSFGDDIASGKVLSNRFRYKAGERLLEFMNAKKLVMGICNGFQVLVKMGLLPTPDFEQRVTLTFNESGKFEDRWINALMNPKSPCIFTKGIERMDLPVRHGEGRLIPASKEILDSIVKDELHVFQYVNPNGETGAYPWNPNGSVLGIGGICDKSGRIFGLMPHPEAYNSKTNHPCWANGVSTGGEGLEIFKNAVDWLEREY